MIIEEENAPVFSNIIEVGDVVKFKSNLGTNFFFVAEETQLENKGYRLVNLECGEIYYRYFQSTKHMHNHLVKHYSEYTLFKASRVKLVIER